MIEILNIFDKVFDVIKSNTSIETQKDLALVLGISQQSISDARVKGRFPMEWLIKLSVLYSINLDTMLGLETSVPTSTDKIIITLIERLEENTRQSDLLTKQLSGISSTLTEKDAEIEKLKEQLAQALCGSTIIKQ